MIRSTLILFLLFLTACPTYKLNTVERSKPLRQPIQKEINGLYTHTPSGQKFPEVIGSFKRISYQEYDDKGNQISLGYNAILNPCRIALTYYTYPAPKMHFIGAAPGVVSSLKKKWVEDNYNASKKDIFAYHKQVELVDERIVDDNNQLTKFGNFKIASNLSMLKISIKDLAWINKTRVTYAKQCRTLTEKAISEFERELNRIN